jgi:nucleoid DNA-binding protein
MVFRKDPQNKEVIEKIAKEHNIDKRVAELAVTSLFKFIADKMKNPHDILPIMIRYLGKFAIRTNSKKAKDNS